MLMIDMNTMANECTRHAQQPILQAIAKTESSFNPYAIGVVGGYLARQPRNKEEAVATALALKAKGFNYSMGCLQVNQINLDRYGLNHETVFDPSTNVKTGAAILDECHARAAKKFGESDLATKAALSCYYSGNFTRGQQKEGASSSYAHKSYAEKVLTNMPETIPKTDSPLAIPVISTKTDKPQARQDKGAKTTGANTDSIKKLVEKKAAPWDVFGEF